MVFALIQPLKYKSRYFQNFETFQNIAQRHLFKPKTDWNFKVVLGLIINTITQFSSLFVFFQIQQ